jgi:hypothetical protein
VSEPIHVALLFPLHIAVCERYIVAVRFPHLTPTIALAFALTFSTAAEAQVLLFSDNFNTADTTNFDGAPLTGRLGGSVGGTETVLRSWGTQQQIDTNQALLPLGGDTGLRFELATGVFGATNRYDWAAGSAGASILAAGGFSVSFDWIPVGNTTTNWISFQVGTVNADSGNLTNDDYGILFRQNGNTERFDNTVNLGAGGAFTATAGGVPRSIRIDYLFNSFADGATVNAISSVNGVQVASDSFTWDSNGGAMRMEIGNNDPGNRVDNVTVSTVPEPSAAAILALCSLALANRRSRRREGR